MACKEYIPDLYAHFLDISLEAHMYASQWFLTLFTAKFPLYMVFHIIDLLLCEVCGGRGWAEVPVSRGWGEACAQDCFLGRIVPASPSLSTS